MMKYIFLIVLLLNGAKTFSCDCISVTLEENQKLSFEKSPLIFIGQIISSDMETGKYEIEILETFKGVKKEGEVLKGRSLTSCSGFPHKGKWLIYADWLKDGAIDFNICGMSRSFDSPQNISVREYIPPAPPKKKNPLTQAELDNISIKLKEKAILDMEKEIENLRNRK